MKDKSLLYFLNAWYETSGYRCPIARQQLNLGLVAMVTNKSITNKKLFETVSCPIIDQVDKNIWVNFVGIIENLGWKFEKQIKS